MIYWRETQDLPKIYRKSLLELSNKVGKERRLGHTYNHMA